MKGRQEVVSIQANAWCQVTVECVRDAAPGCCTRKMNLVFRPRMSSIRYFCRSVWHTNG